MNEFGELAAQAIAVYARPGVSKACLLLQDKAGVDVNILLFAGWMGAKQGVAVATADVERARALVADWHREVVTPIRTVRRRLKQGPPPAPSEKTNQLRTALQAAEISAELIELNQLQDVAREMSGSAAGPGDMDHARCNMLRVVESYAGRPPEAEESNAVHVIAVEAMETLA